MASLAGLARLPPLDGGHGIMKDLVTAYDPSEEGPNKWVAWRGWHMLRYGTGTTEGEAVEELLQLEKICEELEK